jgi:Na+/proline symporter/nitrogen-specific signal transduction histidine kinase
MTLSADVLLLVCVLYVAALFMIAFLVDRSARQGRFNWLRSPVVYTLSISVYCTSWTFYGAVGSAARNGLEFITIYLGPTLVFIGWWWLLRKLVRIGREYRITSIADLISSRYGKSASLAVLVTLIAVVATTPYIALQLQSLTRSYQAIVGAGAGDVTATAFWIAAGMALFTILFGTRNLDANERHHGVVAAIAVEAIVKLFALLAVGLFVVYNAGGLSEIFRDVPAEVIYGGDEIFGPRWAALTFLAATAIICLPRQFQVTVVENVDERHLSTASWLFPLYLLGMCLFIVPIAIAGLKDLPAGSNPDLYVLTLPLAEGRNDLALLAFLGGFSSATSMVILAAIAVSTMVSNHIVMPIALRMMQGGNEVSGDLRQLLLNARRVSIGAILALGYFYFLLSGGSDALAAIGLIAFAGVAQFAPSLVGGIFWRGATRNGALAGLTAGAVVWAYTLFLPSFGGEFLLSKSVLENGPWGIELLRPQALLGFHGADPLVHALVCSLGLNTMLFMVVSVFSEAKPLERLQGAQFVDIFRQTGGRSPTFTPGSANAEDLFILAQRILGTSPARRLFDDLAREQGMRTGLPSPTERVIGRLERELAGSVGAASAHAMVGRLTGAATIGVNELIDIADETQRLIETSRQLSEKSVELERAAAQLGEANDKLRALDAQKDEFLSQISHELRTPMTSIRSFADILLDERGVDTAERQRFLSIIHEESLRLTRLLDEILDISRLESGVQLPIGDISISDAVSGALESVAALTRNRSVKVTNRVEGSDLVVQGNPDRLRQVLINLLSNAVKYNKSADPEIVIQAQSIGDLVELDVIDNGGGVSREDAATVFEKFARGTSSGDAQGAGLGLPISRAIMRAMQGDLTLEFAGPRESFFRASLLGGTNKVPSADDFVSEA